MNYGIINILWPILFDYFLINGNLDKKVLCDWNDIEGPFIEIEILCKRSTSKLNYQIYDDRQWKEVR